MIPNDDCIKRSDAIKALYQGYEKLGLIVYRVSCIEKINKIPAAAVEPKRKSGRWIIAGAFDDFYQCPECGEMWPIFSTIEWKCCPICECKIITNRPKGEENAE